MSRSSLSTVFRCLCACLCAFSIQVSVGVAQERSTIGAGTIFSNDFMGDGQDRWRSGSITASVIRGADWQGRLPSGFGDVLEYRLQSQIIAPQNLTAPAADDRIYAGVLSVGLHSHFSQGSIDYSVGADLVAVGPDTGVSGFQGWAHDAFGEPSPDVAAARQLGNGLHPTALLSATMPVHLGNAVSSRPFVELQAGSETMMRVGGDFVIGSWGREEMMLRDPVTGQLYNATASGVQGVSFVVGGDVAYVADSIYLPDTHGFDLTDARTRVRAGMNWQGKGMGLFYGMTWMGREFEAQPESQILGTLNLKLQF